MSQEKKYLKQLVLACETAIDQLDIEMKKPASNERGKRIAVITNYLDLQKDQAKHFGLGLPLK